jgi:Flp pilus assembly protein TadG
MNAGTSRFRLPRDGRSQRGASAVEFALISIPLLTLLLGLLQYGWYFFAAQSASSGAREATRQLVVGDCTTGSEAESFARTQANLSDLTLAFGEPGADAVTVDNAGTLPDIGDTLRVRVNVDGGIIGFLPMPNSGQIVRVVDARVEDEASGVCS